MTTALTRETSTAASSADRTVERQVGGLRAAIQALQVGLSISRGVLPSALNTNLREFRIGMRRFVVARHPEAVEYILVRNRLNYVKSTEYEPIRGAAGVNLLTDEGESWALHRQVLNPMFAKRHLNQLIGLMVDPIEDMVTTRAAQSGYLTFDMHEEMVQMTLRVVANSLFSQDFGAVVEHMHDMVTRGMRITEVLLRLGLVGALPRPMWRLLIATAYSRLPTPPPFAEIQEIAQGLDKAVNDIVDDRIANPTRSPDLLNMLLHAEEGTWPRQRVRDEALTFMLAGHETTANALSWFWYLMAINPEARDRMLDEIDTVLKGRRVDLDALSNLPWTTACVQESQRYFSAVPMIVRTALEDDEIDGHRVRKGTNVFIPIHAIHHDEYFWENPEEFNPRRFLPGAPRFHRFAYLPFGGGRRVCIGQSFALMEMVAIAAAMSQRFVFDIAPGHPVEPAQSLTLRPLHGLWMVAKRRPPVETIPDTAVATPECSKSADAEPAILVAGCPVHDREEKSR